ncbi:relaxase/mobilization nuclease domain-containing protein [Rhodopila sp.]|uniref:relaxase/mobilization nuclease domain-containing protein n=1 Tax=Rhodopila sp. TaxID=2480087 RepID=UPI003D0E7571
MNVARGGGTGRGSSFKSTVAYVLHDKDRDTKERVGAVKMLNMGGKVPERSWREMQTTCEASTAVKARNGIKQTGRKNEKPVYHYSLSWHPDDKPDPTHMMEKARDTLKLLGLSEHQALIVQHTDRPHAHVHVVVNLVHPETGRTASLAHDGLKLDRWAHEYEVSRNTIRSFKRAAKHERIMEHKKDAARDGFEKAKAAREQFGPPKPEPARAGLSGAHDAAMRAVHVKADSLREQLATKRTALAEKHRTAAQGRLAQQKAIEREYDDLKADIKTAFAPRKPKAPVLELTPPYTPHRRHEGLRLARAMLEQGMFKGRNPIRHAFTQSLSRIGSSEHLTMLAGKFRKIIEGRDVMAPIRSSPEVRKFSEPHLRERAKGELKRAANFALANAAMDYKITRFKLQEAHAKEAGQEKAEKQQFNAQKNRAWADFRRENGLPTRESEWEAKRQANKVRFNEAAKEPVKPEVTKEPVDRRVTAKVLDQSPDLPQANDNAKSLPTAQSPEVQTEMTTDLWQTGRVGDHTYRAKVWAEPSVHGIQRGHISKLEIHNAQGERVALYDGGWDKRPSPWKAERGVTEKIIQFYSDHARELPTVPSDLGKGHEAQQDGHRRLEPTQTKIPEQEQAAPNTEQPSRQKSPEEIAADTPDVARYQEDRASDLVRQWQDAAALERGNGIER